MNQTLRDAIKPMLSEAEEADAIPPMSVEELNKIDMQPLWDFLNEYLGEKYTYTHEFLPARDQNTFRLRFKSPELKDKAGVLSKIFESLTVQQFSTNISYGETHKGWYIWGQASFAFEYRRGSNGHTFASFWYHFNTNRWEFELES